MVASKANSVALN